MKVAAGTDSPTKPSFLWHTPTTEFLSSGRSPGSRVKALIARLPGIYCQ
ncbi:Hypothetical protein NGAL_HAMBI2427_55160 [Neorhizobium galegae bv. orientalis]|nr:Hypothetical protein NGAL_HAMBI2427_55160 [Neorhizobium galegae bv. orientalis]